MIRSSAHTHTLYGDGRNTPGEMAEAALSRGFFSLGFSEHGHMPFDEAFCMSPEMTRAYRYSVRALSKALDGRLSVHLGVERDEFGDSERALYDYVIGSKHYFRQEDDFFAVDSDPTTVERGVRRFFGGNGLRMAKAYFEDFAAYVTAYRPNVVAHFDLLVKYNAGGRFFDEDCAAYRQAGFDALDSMAKTDALLEINTGGMARGCRETPYPALSFLRRWRALGGRITVGSDAHDARNIDYAFDLAWDLAQAAGFRETWALSEQPGRFEPYPLG